MRVFGVGRARSEFFVSTNPQNDWLANRCCPGKQSKKLKSLYFCFEVAILEGKLSNSDYHVNSKNPAIIPVAWVCGEQIWKMLQYVAVTIFTATYCNIFQTIFCKRDL